MARRRLVENALLLVLLAEVLLYLPPAGALLAGAAFAAALVIGIVLAVPLLILALLLFLHALPGIVALVALAKLPRAGWIVAFLAQAVLLLALLPNELRGSVFLVPYSFVLPALAVALVLVARVQGTVGRSTAGASPP